MIKFTIRSISLTLVYSACLALSASAKKVPPNIVVIMADDMGYSDLGCYGGEIATPHLDRLAENGLRFTQFYNTGRCCPTRATLMTGIYAHQAGVGGMTNDRGPNHPGYRGRLNEHCVTIAEVLKPAGYTTMIAGKWHIGNNRPHWPDDRGFERTYAIPQGGGVYFKLKSGRDLLHDGKLVQPPEDWYSTDAFTDHAIEFVRDNKESGKPFFLYMPYIAPHWPLKAREADVEKYLGKYSKGWAAYREARYKKQQELGIIDPTWPLSPRDMKAGHWKDVKDPADADRRMAIYAAQVEVMDANIGKFVNTLQELGLLENTLVLFLMDNGGCAEGGALGFGKSKAGVPIGHVDSHASYGQAWANVSNTPFREYKHWVHEGGISTPLVAHWPAVIKDRGALRKQPTHLIDIMATCVEISGAAYPTEQNGKAILPMEGKSLLAVMEDDALVERDALYWEHEGNRAVRIGDWKLVAKKKGEWELYNVKIDRTEANNRAAEFPERVEALKAKYQAFAKRANI